MTEESEPVTVNFEQELETLTQFVANTKLLYETVPQKQSEKEQAGSIPRKQAPRLSIIDDILMELEDTVSQLGDIYSVPVTIVLYGGSGSGKSVLANTTCGQKVSAVSQYNQSCTQYAMLVTADDTRMFKLEAFIVSKSEYDMKCADFGIEPDVSQKEILHQERSSILLSESSNIRDIEKEISKMNNNESAKRAAVLYLKLTVPSNYAPFLKDQNIRVLDLCGMPDTNSDNNKFITYSCTETCKDLQPDLFLVLSSHTRQLYDKADVFYLHQCGVFDYNTSCYPSICAVLNIRNSTEEYDMSKVEEQMNLQRTRLLSTISEALDVRMQSVDAVEEQQELNEKPKPVDEELLSLLAKTCIPMQVMERMNDCTALVHNPAWINHTVHKQYDPLVQITNAIEKRRQYIIEDKKSKFFKYAKMLINEMIMAAAYKISGIHRPRATGQIITASGVDVNSLEEEISKMVNSQFQQGYELASNRLKQYQSPQNAERRERVAVCKTFLEETVKSIINSSLNYIYDKAIQLTKQTIQKLIDKIEEAINASENTSAAKRVLEGMVTQFTTQLKDFSGPLLVDREKESTRILQIAMSIIHDIRPNNSTCPEELLKKYMILNEGKGKTRTRTGSAKEQKEKYFPLYSVHTELLSSWKKQLDLIEEYTRYGSIRSFYEQPTDVKVRLQDYSDKLFKNAPKIQEQSTNDFDHRLPIPAVKRNTNKQSGKKLPADMDEKSIYNSIPSQPCKKRTLTKSNIQTSRLPVNLDQRPDIVHVVTQSNDKLVQFKYSDRLALEAEKLKIASLEATICPIFVPLIDRIAVDGTHIKSNIYAKELPGSAIFVVMEQQQYQTFSSLYKEEIETCDNIYAVLIDRCNIEISRVRTYALLLAEQLKIPFFWMLDDTIKTFWEYSDRIIADVPTIKTSMERALKHGQAVMLYELHNNVHPQTVLGYLELCFSSVKNLAKKFKGGVPTCQLFDQVAKGLTPASKQNLNVIIGYLDTLVSKYSEQQDTIKPIVKCRKRIMRLLANSYEQIAQVSVCNRKELSKTQRLLRSLDKKEYESHFISDVRYQVVLFNSRAVKGLHYMNDDIFLDDTAEVPNAIRKNAERYYVAQLKYFKRGGFQDFRVWFDTENWKIKRRETEAASQDIDVEIDEDVAQKILAAEEEARAESLSLYSPPDSSTTRMVTRRASQRLTMTSAASTSSASVTSFNSNKATKALKRKRGPTKPKQTNKKRKTQ